MRRSIVAGVIATGMVMAMAGCGSGEASPESGGTEPSTPASEKTETVLAPESEATGASLPQLDGTLMFSRFDESTHTFISTHTAAPDGSRETELTLPGPEGGGRWSNDGEHIAVMTILDDERVGTAVLTPDGSVDRVLRIPDPTLNLVCTVWTPDDSHLACEGWDEQDPARGGIYQVSASDGGDLTRLTKPPADSGDLPGDYSPDGATFVFKRGGDEVPGTLMLLPLQKGKKLKPAALSDAQVEDPGRFSPDGLRIATAAGGRVVVLGLDGKEQEGIEVPDRFLFGPVWSPDGEWLGYSMAADGPFADIYISRPDGTDRHRITDTSDNEIRLEWSRR
jgi:Tol biopolymer transport system component